MTETAAEYLDDRSSVQSNVTLGAQVDADFDVLARYQGTKPGTLLRQILEAHWASPGTQSLIKTAKAWAKENEHIPDRQPRKTTKHRGR